MTEIDSIRRAFLLALFDKADMFHGSYIAEKIDLVFSTKNVGCLVGALDMPNQHRLAGYIAGEKDV